MPLVTQAPTDTSGLSQIIADIRLTNCIAALLVFDHILTFGEEVELIWKSRWNLSKTVYLWQRYFALISLSGLTAARLRGSCGAFYRLEGFAITIVIGVVDFVLVARLIVDGITITIGMRGFYQTLDISTLHFVIHQIPRYTFSCFTLLVH
ncbi:hypothetical protein BD779DRAFT_166398 [Infundibulicybe gibba]|nr:hypothetical protein BD779DRAFT_166398 [Infundibulicybe gibba]